MKHPFTQETVEKKYAYVLGVAMVIFENGEITEKQQNYLKKLVRNIDLGYEELDKILEFARQYQAVKDKVVSVLDTPCKKYCFLMELYNMFYETRGGNQEFIKGVDQFIDLLDIDRLEFNLVRQACMRLEHKNKHYFKEISKQCEENQIFLGENLFKYFVTSESKVLQERVVVQQERILQKGEELIVTGSYKLSGVIKVLAGARLIFKDAIVEMNASVHVEGGYLAIYNSSFKNSRQMQQALFMVRDATVSIESSFFDGNKASGILCQINGELFIENCTFKDTAFRSCIVLWECPARIKSSHFINCHSEKSCGGAVYTNSNIEVLESFFEDCRAYNGAAIYRLAAAIPWVKETSIKVPKRNNRGEENKMIEIFGRRVDFIPVPKSFQRIAYPIILLHNRFLNCKVYKSGIVCAYKSQVVRHQGNIFDRCKGQSIYYYE